jgi:hypothetical protein
MHHLYHGSGYRQTELKPGVHYTGEVVRWDKTESNEWLYATTSMEEAIAQGFASTVEKHFKLARYKTHGKHLELVFDGPVPSIEQLHALSVYLYKIDWIKDQWVKVDNLHNGMTNEYKTQAILKDVIDSCTAVDLRHWLSRKEVKLLAKNAGMNW